LLQHNMSLNHTHIILPNYLDQANSMMSLKDSEIRNLSY